VRSTLLHACVVCGVLVWSSAPIHAQTLAGGSGHSVVLTPQGTVWTFGSNSNGQLGDGTTATHKTPIPIDGLTDVVAVAAGASHTLALTSGGMVWAWGDNAYGQLGDASTTDRRTPVLTGINSVVAIAAGEHHSVALRASALDRRRRADTCALWRCRYGVFGSGRQEHDFGARCRNVGHQVDGAVRRSGDRIGARRRGAA